MITEDDKIKLVDSIVEMAVVSRTHPYRVLNQMVDMYDFPKHQAQNLISECKLILKGRAEELPFNFN